MRSHHRVGMVIAAGVLLAACGARDPSPAPSQVEPSPTAAVQPIATPSAGPATPSTAPSHDTVTPAPGLKIDDLPMIDMATIDATVVCDPYPSAGDENAGRSAIHCTEGTEMALRALRTVTQDPVSRAYLQRPVCAQSPCSVDELNTATVGIWTATQVFSVALDARLETMSPPVTVSDAPWPAAGDTPAPDVRRPTIKDAPPEVAQREPYPFCGRAEFSSPPEVLGCFRDAVLAGRPAEMIERAFGTEGGSILGIFRYSGDGPVVLLEHDNSVDADGRHADRWSRTSGGLFLGATPLTWGFSTWEGTEHRF